MIMHYEPWDGSINPIDILTRYYTCELGEWVENVHLKESPHSSSRGSLGAISYHRQNNRRARR